MAHGSGSGRTLRLRPDDAASLTRVSRSVADNFVKGTARKAVVPLTNLADLTARVLQPGSRFLSSDRCTCIQVERVRASRSSIGLQSESGGRSIRVRSDLSRSSIRPQSECSVIIDELPLRFAATREPGLQPAHACYFNCNRTCTRFVDATGSPYRRAGWYRQFLAAATRMTS
jgi:hypothetical protein